MNMFSEEDSNSQFGGIRGALFSSQYSYIDDEKSQTQGLNVYSIDSNSSNNENESKTVRTLFESQNTSFYSNSQTNESQTQQNLTFSSRQAKIATPLKPTTFSQVAFNSNDIIEESPVVSRSSRYLTQSFHYPKFNEDHSSHSFSSRPSKGKSRLYHTKKEPTPIKFDLTDSKSIKRRTGYNNSNIGSLNRLNSDFIIISDLGSGEYSSVYKCQHRIDNHIYAVKVIKFMKRKVESQRRITRLEAQTMAEIGHHNNIIHYYTCWEEENTFYIQLEYCPYGTVKQLCSYNNVYRQLPEHIIIRLLHDILSALVYIHSMNYCHLDIKSANIFIVAKDDSDHFIYIAPTDINMKGSISQELLFASQHEVLTPGYVYKDNSNSQNSQILRFFSTKTYKKTQWRFKLGDFGLAYKLGSKSNPREGDSMYRSPELMEDNFTDLRKSDLFSLGLVAIEMRSGCELPKNGKEYIDLRKGILPTNCQFSSSLQTIISKLITPNVNLRPNSSDIYNELCSLFPL